METVFLTGATGYLGGYAATRLLTDHPDLRLAALVRAKSTEDGVGRLWRAMQLHLEPGAFRALLPRIEIVLGDLHAPGLGIEAAVRARLVAEVRSILHVAASLNRRSAKACLNTNVRGTLAVIKLARAIHEAGGLRRYSHVSTVAVAGVRDREVVTEAAAIDWERSDYDPYGRTKKLCEHLAHELLPDVQRTIFRPSIVMGDAGSPATTQFDMVRATSFLADLPVVPFRPEWRVDIVDAGWTARALCALHMKAEPRWDTYHLSAGTASPTLGDVAQALHASTGRRIRFAPRLLRPFEAAVDLAAGLRGRHVLGQVGSLMKVFLPYITYDTVFDNARVTDELGLRPAPFTSYGEALYRWAKTQGFRYPYRDLPPASAAPSATEAA